MTSGNDVPGEAARTMAGRHPGRREHQIRLADVRFSERMWARLFAARFDRQIEDGVTVAAGTPLAAHYVRLASRRERDDMADAVRWLLRDADPVPRIRGSSARMPFDTDAVRRSTPVVEDVLARLTGPLPVRARGMARLRLMLGDGRSPLYRAGRGTFAAAMRGVLAAM